VIFQGIFRNPMADPFIIGVSSGASLGATIGLLIMSGVKFLNLSAASILAFGGAIAVTFLVYNISRIKSKISVVTLLLSGVAISALISSINSFILIFRTSDLAKVIFWLMGGFTSSTWLQFFTIAPVILVLLVVSSFFMKDLNLISLSDERASQLGVETEKVKKILLVLASLIAAAAVSVSGIIGFVGLITPHIMRLIVGPDHKVLYPTSAIAGGIVLLFSDTIARTILSPREIPVGIITSIIGVPFFIYLLLRSKREIF
ncbi:MAG: iron chelate uptake ABC transporter family permease subunit, partial [Actinobacteria bacterium]|nr:iron chelate uptake ABC transporter family permease subunit [Actinomycetota bacterium]